MSHIYSSKTFQSVDSIVPPHDLFQMAVSQSHGIKEGGLNSLSGVLAERTINLYFLTLIERGI